jgi:hypothetical protein
MTNSVQNIFTLYPLEPYPGANDVKIITSPQVALDLDNLEYELGHFYHGGITVDSTKIGVDDLDDDFTLVGFDFVGVVKGSGYYSDIDYAIFNAINFNDAWTGSINVAPSADFIMGASEDIVIIPRAFDGDVTAPFIQSITTSNTSGSTTTFLVKFSEPVAGSGDPPSIDTSAFKVPAGFNVQTVTPTFTTDSSIYASEYQVVVNRGSGTGTPTLELAPTVAISSISFETPPNGSYPTSTDTSGKWLKVELDGPVPIENFYNTYGFDYSFAKVDGISSGFSNVAFKRSSGPVEEFYIQFSPADNAVSLGNLNVTLDPYRNDYFGPSIYDEAGRTLSQPPQILTAITAKVDGISVTDGSDANLTLDVLVNKNDVIDITFTFASSIDPATFTVAADLLHPGLSSISGLTPVAGSDDTQFVARFSPSGTNSDTWTASVGINPSAVINDEFAKPISTLSMSHDPLLFVGDTLAPSAPTNIAPTATGFSTTNVVKYAAFTPSVSDFSNANTLNYFIDGATSPTFSLQKPATDSSVPIRTVLDLADGSHTVRAQAVDAAGNVSTMSSNVTFTVDSVAPQLMGVTKLLSTELPIHANLPQTGSYFSVTFSEDVVAVNASDFRVLNANGSSVPSDTIAVYSSSGTLIGEFTSTTDDQYFVRVNSELFTGTVELAPVVEIVSTTAVSGIPPGISQLSTTPSGGTWVKIDLNRPVDASTSLDKNSLGMSTSQSGITAPYVVETLPGTTAQSLYAYVKSTSTANLDVSKLSAHIMPTVGSNLPFIADGAGNRFTTDFNDSEKIEVIGAAITPTEASNPAFVVSPKGGTKGFDTLDLTAIWSAGRIEVFSDYGQIIVPAVSSNVSPTVYSISEFDRFVIESAGGANFYGSQNLSEVVQLKVISSNEIRLDNRATTDLAAETDVVDYSATSAAVTVDLSVTTGSWNYATASKAGSNTTDKISGAEGIIGSTGNDDITGDARSNLLVGGMGADKLVGGGGNDVLIGGDSTKNVSINGVITPVVDADILIGGTGKDVLIDLDGGTLQGSTSAKAQDATNGDKDVFIVRTGATIENYHVARDGAGLAGRAFSSVNDTIVFNLSLHALTASLGDLATAMTGATKLNAAELQVALAEIKGAIDIRVVRVQGDADDWVAIASYNGSWLSASQTAEAIITGPVELARVVLKDMTTIATGSVLTDVALPDFSLTSPQNLAYFEKIDSHVFNQVSDLLVEDEAINIGFVLEAVREGTVREVSANGLMFGNNSFDERIFNPGAGDQKIFGSNKKDTYEFVVQDLTIAGATTTNAGNDRIVDTGGLDTVAFSSIALDQIAALNFEAVKFGREAGNYTLKSNYSQTEGGVTNSGAFTWLGHFREGFDMGLEQIKLGDTILEMADVLYTAGSKTPIQQAMEGVDTIMVGGAGQSTDRNIFKLKADASASVLDGGDLYIWGIDQTNDVIDLKDFISASSIATNNADKLKDYKTQIASKVDPSGVANKFSVSLDNNEADTNELTIHFMGMGATPVSEGTLEEMIARAYLT